MMKAPDTLPQLESVQMAYELMSSITDVADHMSPNYYRASLAMQLLNGTLTREQAQDYADDIPED